MAEDRYDRKYERIGNSYSEDVADGLIANKYPVNKFGKSPGGIQTTATDIWSLANATPTQSTWLAPTAARTHQIVSGSANDAVGGTGCNTLKIYGLTSWEDTIETSEIINMNGASNVATENDYVIIYRMKSLVWGSAGPNAGAITATADTDSTITATILAGEGQTQMAIFGVPNGKVFKMKKWRASINKASGAAAHAVFSIMYNSIPNLVTTKYVLRDSMGLQSTGKSGDEYEYDPPKRFVGPGIVKIQATASANDLDGHSGFDGIIS